MPIQTVFVTEFCNMKIVEYTFVNRNDRHKIAPKLMYGRGMCKIQNFPVGVGMHTPQTPLRVGGLHLPHTTVSPRAQKHLSTPLQWALLSNSIAGICSLLGPLSGQ